MTEIKLDLDDDEMAVVADAIYLHRQHLADFPMFRKHWFTVQSSVEYKLRAAGVQGIYFASHRFEKARLEDEADAS